MAAATPRSTCATSGCRPSSLRLLTGPILCQWPPPESRPSLVPCRSGRPSAAGAALYIDIQSRESVTATVTVTRNGKTLAHKAVAGVRGTRRIRLDIPPRTKPGPARLRLRLRNSAGVTKVITRTIQIPRALPGAKP